MRFGLTAFLAVLVTMSACGPSQSPDDAPPTDSGPTLTQVFECPGAFRFVAQSSAEHIWLFLPSRTVKLPATHGELTPPNSGSDIAYQYRNQHISLWRRGETAQLTLDGTSIGPCTNNRREAIWEDAKLNGVSFRATGNEPPWVLEIGSEVTTLYQGYDRIATQYDNVTPVKHADGSFEYQLRNDTQHMLIRIVPKPCNDTMASLSTPTQVQIQLDDGTLLHGCGRALY